MENGNLWYHRTEQEHLEKKSPLKGHSIDLCNSTIRMAQSVTNGFEIIPSSTDSVEDEQTWQMKAEDDSEQRLWVKSLISCSTPMARIARQRSISQANFAAGS
jgi:hypothetical protein